MAEMDVVAYCVLIIGYGAICYIAGKGDVLNLIPKMLLEKAKDIEKKLEAAQTMFYCERCGDADCCERLDLKTEPVLCDKCYEEALANGERSEVDK